MLKLLLKSVLWMFLLVCLSTALMLTLQSCSSPTAPEVEPAITNADDALQAELERRRADGRDPFGVICYSWFDYFGQPHFRCTFVAVGDDI